MLPERARVLIVEDQDLVGDELARLVEAMGHEVAGRAKGGREAIARAGALRPDVALVDIELADDVDGIEAARVMRAEFDVPCVFLTSARDGPTMERAARARGSGYVIKPFHDAQVRAALELALANHRAQRQARRSEQRFSALADLLPVGILVHGADGAILYANRGAEELLVSGVGGLAGRSPAAVLAGALTEEGMPLGDVGDPVRAAMATGRPVRDCVVQLPAHGLRRRGWLLLSATPLFYEDGRVQGALTTVLDLTARRLAEDELATNRKMSALGSLAAAVAHEFNNLLTPVVLQAEALRERLARDEEALAMIHPIVAAAERARKLIANVVRYGRTSQENPERRSVEAVVRAVLDVLRHTSDRRIAVEFRPGAGSERVPRLSEGELDQVVLNLLLNARDTLLEKLERPTEGWRPEISVVVEACEAPRRSAAPFEPGGERRWVRIRVRDNGLGIDPQHRERLFEPFFTTHPDRPGAGFGLAAVWGVAHRAGGQVEIETEPGIGSTFTVVLPVTDAVRVPRSETPPPFPPGPPVALGRSGRPVRILYVEDHDLVGQAVRRLLERNGYAVTWADHGTRAWEQIAASPDAFDVLLTDFNLPGLTGIELIERAQRGGFTGRTVMLSAYLNDFAEEESRRLGVDLVLQKPSSPRELLGGLLRLARS